MKVLFTKLGGVLRRAWVWSLLLFLGCGLLIWFVGPHLAFDDYRPWAESVPRLLTLCALALGWGLFLVFSGWRQAQGTRVMAHDHQQPDSKAPATEYDHKGLRLRFKLACRTLSQARLYHGRSERWRKALPWYVLLGPEGSGKTSLLEYSGLNLPFNPRQNKATAPPAPTLDCDWYFAEHGVLLDTCGSYLTQAEDVSVSGWHTLLTLVGRHRRNKPLNGVLINLPVSLLLAKDEKPLDQLAEQVLSRLEDIHRSLHSQSPVYLVLSKADEVRGFECFYTDMGQEQSRQPLGFSFSETQSVDGQLLHQKFGELLDHLGSQVAERTRRERQPQRVAEMLDFPRQLGMLTGPLERFVEKAFRGNRFQPSNSLRGVYLTSAPHWVESKPPTERSAESTKRLHIGACNATQMHGQAHFIHDLLARIIFSESDLAALNNKEVRRIRWQQLAMCGAALGCIGLCATLWAEGFSQSEESLARLHRVGEQLARDRLALSESDDVFAVLPGLDSSHTALQLFVAEGARPLGRIMKLDQGNATQPVLFSAYKDELQHQLLPRIARQLAIQLRNNLNNRDELLDSLRAYLMLNDLSHRDTVFLSNRLAAQWRTGYAATPANQQKLRAHLAQLLEQPFRIELDSKLIEQARQALRNTPVAELAYQVMKEKAHTLPDYHLGRQVDPYGALFVERGDGIPGFYTRKNYERYFLAQGMSLVQQSLREDWVMGRDSPRDVRDIQTLMAELEQLYLRDYADHWSRAIGEIQRVPLDGAVQGTQQAALLTAANSPLIKLLIEIRENTRFERPGKVPNVAVTADKSSAKAKAATDIAEQVKTALLDPLPNNGRIALQRRFEAIHWLLDDDSNPAPELNAALQALNNLHLQLATVARSSQPEQAAFELAKSRMGGQVDAIGQVRTSTSRLPAPLNNWVGTLADESWGLLLNDAYRYVNQRYQSELYNVYTEALAKRYPFNAGSESDVALADFREFFKGQGIAEQFFDTYLRPFVKGESKHYRLRSVDGRSLPMSPHSLSQMSRVYGIRRSFFSEDPGQPRIKFSLEPYSLDPSLSRADFQFGDKQLEYRHGPVVPLALQWPNEADNGITSLIVEHPSGRRVGYQENSGPWSLFRMIERLEHEPHSGRDVLMLKAELEGRRVNYLLMSQRSPNPFVLTDLRGFKLPAVL